MEALKKEICLKNILSPTVPILNKINFSMYLTYVLKSLKNNKFYVGYSGDFKNRLELHNKNVVFVTKNKGPWQLVYSEQFTNEKDAIIRERQIKSWKSRKAIEKLILK